MNDQLQKAAEAKKKLYEIMGKHSHIILEDKVATNLIPAMEEYATWRLSQLPPVDEKWKEKFREWLTDFLRFVPNVRIKHIEVMVDHVERYILPKPQSVSQSAGVWVRCDNVPKRAGKFILRIVDPKTKEQKEYVNFNTSWVNPSGDWHWYNIPPENYYKYEYLDESPVSQLSGT